ncbi:MAG: GxxExxY protein [Planctomycetes bacterium]|nr:GxxExxY protein [Planctomycetota bacterium]
MARELEKYLDDLSFKVIGSAIEVHRYLGPGYLESVYEEALAVELHHSGIPYERQKSITLIYKNHEIGKFFLDFLVAKCLILELKAVEEFADIHKAQIISYLKSTNLQLGLLINFNVPVLKDGIQRIVLT